MKVAEELTQIAEVSINIQASRLRHSFSYIVPDELAFIGPGWRIVVPFGSSDIEGFVVALRELRPGEDSRLLKSIKDAPDVNAWFDAEMMATAHWISEYYVCSLGEALRLFIPGKSGIKVRTFFIVASEFSSPVGSSQLFEFVRQKGPVEFDRLRAEFGAGCRNELDQLLQMGLIVCYRQTRQRVTAKWTRTLRLNVSLKRLEEILFDWKGKPAQRNILQRLSVEQMLTVFSEPPGIPYDSAVKSLLKAGLIYEQKIQFQRDSFCDVAGDCKTVQLTRPQRAAVDEIVPAIRSGQARTFLLHGVTGSGKTEVYLRTAAAVINEGKQVLVMIPEIAQAHQVLRRFRARFGSAVAVVHSRLSVAERRDVWDFFRNRKIDIVIGTRSALFLPGAGLGLIIIDEEHEFTYKQEENPRYHVRETALKRAAKLGAVVLLGSATPSLESFHATKSGRFKLLTLPERIDGSCLPTVEVVDMREQLKLGRKSVISEPLERLLVETVNKKEQAILLLNRRGHSTFVMCRECGFVMRCDHCSVPLVFHMQGGTLRCHYCDSFHKVPSSCPACHGRYIRFFGAGTQRLEEDLALMLPGVRLTRMDQDTTGGKRSHEMLLDSFRQAKSDILLGTQMVAKGHDIQNVTAVGILAADSSLNLPDFRSAERTFSLVMQAAGRAGRGSKAGRVVVQTYHPEHYAMVAGTAQDYESFYRQEIGFRKELQYPPYAQFLKLTTTGPDEDRAMKVAEQIAAAMESALGENQHKIEIIGPYVAPVAKIGDVFRVHMLLRGKNLSAAKQLLIDQGIVGMRNVIIDVDPLGMM